jgi:hypothetical protein
MRIGQYIRGSAVRPSADASGEYGNHAPKAMMESVVTINGQLARLRRKGILLVRMTWMMSVWVIMDSTNHPVWKTDARDGSQQWKTQSITKKVV